MVIGIVESFLYCRVSSHHSYVDLVCYSTFIWFLDSRMLTVASSSSLPCELIFQKILQCSFNVFLSTIFIIAIFFSVICGFFFFLFSSTTSLLPTHFPPLSCTHAQSCNPMDCSPPGFSVHGLFQARILAWVAISFSIICVFKKIFIYWLHQVLVAAPGIFLCRHVGFRLCGFGSWGLQAQLPHSIWDLSSLTRD